MNSINYLFLMLSLSISHHSISMNLAESLAQRDCNKIKCIITLMLDNGLNFLKNNELKQEKRAIFGRQFSNFTREAWNINNISCSFECYNLIEQISHGAFHQVEFMNKCLQSKNAVFYAAHLKFLGELSVIYDKSTLLCGKKNDMSSLVNNKSMLKKILESMLINVEALLCIPMRRAARFKAGMKSDFEKQKDFLEQMIEMINKNKKLEVYHVEPIASLFSSACFYESLKNITIGENYTDALDCYNTYMYELGSLFFLIFNCTHQ